MQRDKVDSQKIFYFMYMILLMETTFSTVYFLKDILRYISYIILIFLILYIIYINRNCKKDEIVKLVIGFSIIAISALISKDKKLLKVMLIIMAFKNISFDEFIKKDFKYRLLFFVIVILLNFLGLTVSENMIRINSAKNVTVRYSLGFVHPNILGLYTLSLCLEYLYINRNTKNIKHFIITISTLLFNVFVTDSRACIGALILILLFLCIKMEYIKKIFDINLCKFLIRNIYLIFTIFLLLIVISYKSGENNIINKIDNLLSTRIQCANYYITHYNSFLPFGQYIERLDGSISKQFLPLDIGYIHILIKYGSITFLLILLMYNRMLKKMFEFKNYTLISFFIVWTCYSALEVNALFDLYNPFLLALSVFFYDNIKKVNKNNKMIEGVVNGI